MPNWRDEYLTNIQDAESSNPVNKELISAYSQLVDRLSSLEAEKQAWLQSPPNPTTPSSTSKQDPTTTTPSTSPALLPRLRADLAEALRQNGSLLTRLKAQESELAHLRTESASSSRLARDLAAERKALARKLRDREDELRQKNKLVADVQDELAVLNLQLTVAERERKKAQDETKALVDRWMKRVGQEAEAMNVANEPALARKR